MEQEKKKTRILDEKQGRIKAEAFCAYQERYQQEVRDRLYEWGLHKETVEAIIADLISNNFLNEERFAKAFAGGKFRIKKWGRVKIMIELKKRKITPYCIRKGMQEIEEKDYTKTLHEMLRKKARIFRLPLSTFHFQKLAQYAISKGYEPSLVRELLKKEGLD